MAGGNLGAVMEHWMLVYYVGAGAGVYYVEQHCVMSRRLLSIRLPRARQEAAPSAESSWITSALHLTPSLASIASLEGCEWPWIAVDSPWKARYTLDRQTWTLDKHDCHDHHRSNF